MLAKYYRCPVGVWMQKKIIKIIEDTQEILSCLMVQFASHAWYIFRDFPSQDETNPPLSASPHISDAPISCLIFLLDLLKYPCLSRWGAQNCTQHSRFGITSAEEKTLPTRYGHPTAAQNTLHLLGCEGVLWAQLGIHQALRVTPLSSSPASWPWAWPCAWELFLPGCNTLLHIFLTGLGITPWGIALGTDPPLLDFVLLVTAVWACN